MLYGRNGYAYDNNCTKTYSSNGFNDPSSYINSTDSLQALIKEAEPKAPTEARHNDKFDTVYDAAYTNGVNAYSEQISNLFNKEEKEESNDFI